MKKSQGDSGTFGPAMKNVPNSLAKKKKTPLKAGLRSMLVKPKMSVSSVMKSGRKK